MLNFNYCVCEKASYATSKTITYCDSRLNQHNENTMFENLAKKSSYLKADFLKVSSNLVLASERAKIRDRLSSATPAPVLGNA